MVVQVAESEGQSVLQLASTIFHPQGGECAQTYVCVHNIQSPYLIVIIIIGPIWRFRTLFFFFFFIVARS